MRERSIEENGFLLRRYHRGWFDVAHGWIQRFMVRVSKDFCLQPAGDSDWASRQSAGRIERARIISGRIYRPSFDIPSEWEKREVPRYLFFRYALPVSGSHFLIRGYVGSRLVLEVGSGIFEPHYRLTPLPALVDLVALVGSAEEVLFNLELEFELLGGDADDTLLVQDAVLISDVRQDLRHQLTVLRDFNMGFSAFTSHAIGIVLGARTVGRRAAADPRWLGDFRANPHYCKDLLEEAGIEFFNTFNNTSQERLLPLSRIIQPAVYNDGSVSYDFNRYFYWERSEDGEIDMDPFDVEGRTCNPSVGETLGYHVQAALDRLDSPGTGALIYTHAAMRCPVLMEKEKRATGKEPDPFEAIGHETRAVLEELVNRFYNLTGRVPEKERVWVAPTSVLLRQAQVQRRLGEHSWYDPEQNVVYVETWFDEVTGLPVPHPDKGMADLRWSTFYVEDAGACRLFVDDQEITHLIRNPADASGRPSVTVADIGCPTVVIDEVPLEESGYLSSRDMAFRWREGDAFRGGWSLELSAQADREGRLEYRPWKPVDLRNHQMLRMAFARVGPGALNVRITLSDGSVWLMGDDVAGACGIPFRGASGWRDVVLPFWLFDDVAQVGPKRPPTGCIQAIVFQVRGTVAVDCFELLRDYEAPASRGGCIVGGRIVGQSGMDLRLRMIAPGGESETRPTPSGYYVFPDKVPKGSVVTVFGMCTDGTELRPLGGFRHGILRDLLDIDFETG